MTYYIIFSYLFIGGTLAKEDFSIPALLALLLAPITLPIMLGMTASKIHDNL